MPTGTITTIVPTMQRTYISRARVPDCNERGYGIIADAEGREVYFAHEAVEGRRGFDALRRGVRVEFVLEKAPYSHMAKKVRVLAP